MIDAKMSFAPVEIAQADGAQRGKRLPVLVGLSLAAAVSISLWAGLALMVSRLF